MAERNPLATRAYVDDVLGGIPISPGVDSYNDLKDLPSINGVTLKGDVTIETGGLGESDVRRIANSAVASEVGKLSKVAKTGQYSDLGGLPTVNGMELKGDVTIETGGLNELQTEAVAARVAEGKIATLAQVVHTGSYDDLTDRPRINGQVLTGDRAIETGLSEPTVRTVAGEVADGKLKALPKVTRTGSYSDLTDKPTINGVVVEGDITFESGGLDELQMESVAARVAKSQIDGLPSSARTGSYSDLKDLPSINGAPFVGNHTIETGLSEAAVREVAGRVADGKVNALPDVARTGSFNDLLNVPTINGVPLSGGENIELGGVSESRVTEIVQSAVAGGLSNAKKYTDESIDSGQTRFSGAVKSVELDVDESVLAEVCDFLGLDSSDYGSGAVTVGVLLAKTMTLIKSLSDRLVDQSRYSLVTVDASEPYLRDRAMNQVTVAGTFYPPPSVNGKARDFQVSVFNAGSLVVDVDLGHDTVFMDDARMNGSVVHVSGTGSDGSDNVRMAIFTEVSAGVWYVNNIYDGSRTEESSE